MPLTPPCPPPHTHTSLPTHPPPACCPRPGLFRGFSITLIRDVPSFAFYFTTYHLATAFFGGALCPEREAARLRSSSTSSSQEEGAVGADAPQLRAAPLATTLVGEGGWPAAVPQLAEEAGQQGAGGGPLPALDAHGGAGGASPSCPGAATTRPGAPIGGAAALLVAGGLAGMASWFGVYPLDVIKSRVQAVPRGAAPYRTWLGCAARIWRQEGPTAFRRGLGATVARAAVVNAATFAGYEWAIGALSGEA